MIAKCLQSILSNTINKFENGKHDKNIETFD